mgnify:CR=1 FL=1
MRQHVNPLSRFFQSYIDIPSPEDIFLNPELPIHLDIGCAKGQYLLDFASNEKKWNFLGIDIRSSLITFAEIERNKLGIENLYFVFCNANVSIEKWLLKLRYNQLQRVSIQFPDPWFKKKHRKRRVLQPSLLLALTSSLNPGAEIFLQSDVYNVIEPMVNLIQLTGCYDLIDNERIWIDENPFNVPTEREKYSLERNLKIYRSIFFRNKRPICSSLLENI